MGRCLLPQFAPEPAPEKLGTPALQEQERLLKERERADFRVAKEREREISRLEAERKKHLEKMLKDQVRWGSGSLRGLWDMIPDTVCWLEHPGEDAQGPGAPGPDPCGDSRN